MKNLKELDQQLKALYELQKEQQQLLTQRVEVLQQLFSPIQVIGQTVKQALVAPLQNEETAQTGYSHLWDAITSRLGIESPVVKSVLHLFLDQLLQKFDQRTGAVSPPDEKKSEALAVYHSANHF